MNEENIIQILGELIVCEKVECFKNIQQIFACLSDEDCDHVFFEFILGFISNEPIHKSLLLLHAFLSGCTLPQTYIIELIEQQHYEILAIHLQLQPLCDNNLKQIILDKLKEQNNDYNKIFLLQRLYFLFDSNKKETAEQIFNNNLKIIQQIFATIQEETLIQYLEIQNLLVIYCKEIQQQKLLKLITLIKQQNQQMSIQLQWIIYQILNTLGLETKQPINDISIKQTETDIQFRLYYMKQKFIQSIKSITQIMNESEQKENFRLYAQWQLQL